jgi:hypothetical protein
MVVKADNDDKVATKHPFPFPNEQCDAIEYYMAERAFVEATVSDDDRMFDLAYLFYADGWNTIQDLYNPHEFDYITRIRYMNWIQRQLDAIDCEDAHSHAFHLDNFWNNDFYRYHNVRHMYNAWKLAI